MISIMIPIAPVAWGRVKRGRYGQAYVPAKTRSFERDAGLIIKSKYSGPPLSGALKLTVTFVLARPKGTKREYPSVRPDLDNYEKAILDAGNGILWKDDGQICGVIKWKVYGDSPHITLRVETL